MATPVVAPILPLNNEGQELSPIDQSYVSSVTINSNFDTTKDIIEAYLYDRQDNFITRITTNYNVTQGVVSGSTITKLNLDPGRDLLLNNITQGSYKLDYNFLSPIVENNELFNISEVSGDRTELRVKNVKLTAQQVEIAATAISEVLNTGETFQGYYLDFQGDNILLGVNVAYDAGTILVKLYAPLPFTFDINSNFNFVRKVSEPVAFSVEFPEEEIILDTRKFLRGPNLNIQLQKQTNNSTQPLDYSTLMSASSTGLVNQLSSVLAERRAELNTDYTDYNNFVFFSSAEQRLANFYLKASQIESCNTQIATLSTLTASPEVSSSKALYERKIRDIITNFDGYDYYLYYESGSTAWPKSNSTKPYTLYSTGSNQVIQWYAAQSLSASIYDSENTNYIYNIYPTFITEDSDNAPFQLFNDMVAQMFDQIWLYTKALENRQDGDNSLEGGISVDVVADALKSYGITLYESNFTNNDLYTSYIGISPGGSTLPPTGSELITTYITASAETTAFNDAQKLIYKRLYHNLPYLLKKKGTAAGLRVLLNCFGIPDTIIRISEFGGKDKNPNTWDQYYPQFNYELQTQGTTYLTSSFSLNTSWNATSNRPQAVEFRFKTTGIPSSSYYSQSLWSTDTGTGLILQYTGSAYTSGSYSGSVVNPYNEYGTLVFYPTSSNLNTTASIYLPFFDGGWWSILINNEGSGSFTIYAKNKIYQGADGNTIGFSASSSISASNNWNSATKAYLASSSFSAKIFSGSLQELRYYTVPVGESSFNDYVMNPGSIEESLPGTQLAFRAALGGELYTGSISIHPKVTGSWATTSSFANTSTFYYSSTPAFRTNYEYYYVDQIPAGIQNPVSKKIVERSTTLPFSGSTNIPNSKVLSALTSIQQQYAASESITRDVNYIEVAFSPQNEINDDINASLGYINIGDYIGDPRSFSSDQTYYPELQTLSEDYFEKYTGKYNWNDYIRLIKYFDNSVFRMIKDFIPARAGAATGIVIKQHLLERNRQRPAQIGYTQPEYTASVVSLARDYNTGSIQVFSGAPGGSVNAWMDVSQPWSSSILTKAGIVDQINSSKYEFYNGAFSGSNIDVVNGQLQDNPLLALNFTPSIPDRQNLNVNSAAFIVSASVLESGTGYYVTSGSMRFNNLVDSITYYNTATYRYTPNYNVLANAVINISASIISGSQETGELYIYLYQDNKILSQASYNTTTAAQIETFTLNLTIPNIYLISGSVYEVRYRLENNFPTTTTSASIHNTSNWTFDTVNLFAQSTYYTDPTVYTQQNFPGNINQYSDYNVLLNNVISNRVSNEYQDVDYSSDAYKPVNYQSIISQSAIYAQVQDSNYVDNNAWSTLRYDGSKNTGQYNLSQSFASQSIAPGYPVDKYSSYFIYFDWIGGSDPQYPGGGNIHALSLIGPDGTATPLTLENKNLQFVENLFSTSQKARIWPLATGSATQITQVEIVTGGGLYETIVVVTASAASGFDAPVLNGITDTQQTASIYTVFTSGSKSTLTDSGSLAQSALIQNSWISIFTNKSSSFGNVQYFSFENNGAVTQKISFWNKQTGTYVNSYPNTINYTDTYLPLQYGDIIRFGNTGSYSATNTSSLDGTFTGGGLFEIVRINTGSNSTVSSSIEITPLLSSFSYVNSTAIKNPLPSSITQVSQNFRIMRRVPYENFVVVKNIPANRGAGFLIPENYNPDYNVYDLARKAGII